MKIDWFVSLALWLKAVEKAVAIALGGQRVSEPGCQRIAFATRVTGEVELDFQGSHSHLEVFCVRSSGKRASFWVLS